MFYDSMRPLIKQFIFVREDQILQDYRIDIDNEKKLTLLLGQSFIAFWTNFSAFALSPCWTHLENIINNKYNMSNNKTDV